VTRHVDAQQVSAWDTVAQKWVVGTGARKVSLASASDEIQQTVTVDVLASVKAPTLTKNLAATTTVKVGKKVTLSAAATGAPAPTVRWQRSTNKGKTWTDVAGATSTTYSFTATKKDAGLRVRAVFTNDLGTVTTKVTTVKLSGALTVSKPVIKGKAKVGVTLKASVKKHTAGAKVKYQWLRGGKVIKGATSAKHKVVKKDKGKKLSVKATVSKTGYVAVSKTSKATKKVVKK